MELEKIIEILEKHQEWRRDQSVPPKTEMQSPIEIGTAIDYALSELKNLRLGSVSKCDCPPLVACEICGEEKNLDGDFWKNKKKHDC